MGVNGSGGDLAMTDFVAVQWPRLVRSARMLGCSKQDAEDLAQDTLVRCVRHWRRVSRAESPQAYVYTMLLNNHRDLVRRAGRRRGSDPSEAFGRVADVADARVEEVRMQQALADLSMNHRRILVLRYYCDLSLRETAHVLGIPEGTAKSRTARALSELSDSPHFIAAGRSVP